MLFSDDDPILVIYTPRAQFVVCLGCLVYFRPARLLPIMEFVLIGREFVRKHRFCKPQACFATLRMILAKVTTKVEMRDPGEEG